MCRERDVSSGVGMALYPNGLFAECPVFKFFELTMSMISRAPPHKKGLTLGSSSFTRCFGASAPLSPQSRGHAQHSPVSYRKLGLEDDILAEEYKLEEDHIDEKGAMKLCKQTTSFITSEEGGGSVMLGKKSTFKEIAAKTDKESLMGSEMFQGGKPGFRAKMRDACLHVLETARRSSPHVSELFVGNQLLLQVTSSSSINASQGKNLVPSPGFLVMMDHPQIPPS